MTVAEIKEAVNKLPAQERLRLLAELCDWSDDEWDRQMKRDAAVGKFAGLNQEAEAWRKLAEQTRFESGADHLSQSDIDYEIATYRGVKRKVSQRGEG